MALLRYMDSYEIMSILSNISKNKGYKNIKLNVPYWFRLEVVDFQGKNNIPSFVDALKRIFVCFYKHLLFGILNE